MKIKHYLIILFVGFFALAISSSPALAGGSSDTSGDGFHCYLFFSLPKGEFAQAMINDSKENEVIKKAEEFIDKYEGDEKGVLDLAIGNIDGTVCAPKVCLSCEEQCRADHDACVADCKVGDKKCLVKCQVVLKQCLTSCVPECTTNSDCSKKERCCLSTGECVPIRQHCPR